MSDTGESGRSTSDGRPTEGDAVSDRCAYCDGPIPTEEWHPVATVRDDDGAVEIYDFCKESCRAAWESERASEE